MKRQESLLVPSIIVQRIIGVPPDIHDFMRGLCRF